MLPYLVTYRLLEVWSSTLESDSFLPSDCVMHPVRNEIQLECCDIIPDIPVRRIKYSVAIINHHDRLIGPFDFIHDFKSPVPFISGNVLVDDGRKMFKWFKANDIDFGINRKFPRNLEVIQFVG